MDLSAWRGKVALVTGASSGIGRATARALALAGIRVAVCARREEALHELAAEVGDAGTLLVVPADLRRVEDITAVFEQIRRSWGGVDVLVNNAGLGHGASLMSGATEEWREMLEVNVLALCVCTREAISDMRRRGDTGQIIHISSMSGHRVTLGAGAYAATKHAVRALTEGLRAELRAAKSAIRVTALSPGFVETEFAGKYHGDPEKARETYAQYKVLESEDIARSVQFVLAQPAHVEFHDLLVRPTHQTT